jgi:hypothetical protein
MEEAFEKSTIHEKFSLISSKDNTKIQIFKQSARLSGLLKNILEEYNEDNGDEDITIPEIEGQYLIPLAEFLNHYRDFNPRTVPKPLEKYDIADLYGVWEEEYITKIIQKGKKNIWGLMEAANFFDCKDLLELSASKVACTIKNLSGHEMLEYFELQEDMTEEDVIKMEDDFEKEMEEKYKEKINSLTTE